jgi:glycosyltransferase involved in cell wall biosynthesis
LLVQHQVESALVSVIIPMYNAERYIVDTLTSILQDCSTTLEVIVVNDSSTDGSLRRVHKIHDDRLRIINSQGRGIAAALNTGIAAARGEIITRCDADDLYPAKRLMQQVSWLLKHPEFGAVCGGYAAIDAKGGPVIELESGGESTEITAELRQGVTRTHFCTFAVRTELLRALGGFRSYFLTGEDIDLQLRLGDACRVWYLPGVHYRYRLHRGSVTHTKSSTEREFFDAIAREFQKQRLLTGQDDLDRGTPPALPGGKCKPPLTAAQHIQGFLLGEAWREYRNGQQLQALMKGMRSALTLPSNLSVWRSLLSLAAKSIYSSTALSLNSTSMVDRHVD